MATSNQEPIQGLSPDDLADWVGGTLTDRFRTNVPGELFDILIVELIPLMVTALAKDNERRSVTP